MCLPRSASKERFCLGWENSLAHEVLAAVAWECEIKSPKPHEATVIWNPSTKWKSASGEFLKTCGPSSLSCMKLSNNNKKKQSRKWKPSAHTSLTFLCMSAFSHGHAYGSHMHTPYSVTHTTHTYRHVYALFCTQSFVVKNFPQSLDLVWGHNFNQRNSWKSIETMINEGSCVMEDRTKS